MDGAASSTLSPSGVQGICPEGWHLPSDAEWETLAEYIVEQTGLSGKSEDNWTQIGVKLKSTAGWNSTDNGTDDFGFAGLAAGFRSTDGSFYTMGYNGFFWSSIGFTSSYAFYRYLNYGFDYFSRHFGSRSLGRSVRCVKD